MKYHIHCQYVAGKGMQVMLPGQTVFLPAHWYVSAIANHLYELEQYLSDTPIPRPGSILSVLMA